jgi:hypothetical protein
LATTGNGNEANNKNTDPIIMNGNDNTIPSLNESIGLVLTNFITGGNIYLLKNFPMITPLSLLIPYTSVLYATAFFNSIVITVLGKILLY